MNHQPDMERIALLERARGDRIAALKDIPVKSSQASRVREEMRMLTHASLAEQCRRPDEEAAGTWIKLGDAVSALLATLRPAVRKGGSNV